MENVNRREFLAAAAALPVVASGTAAQAQAPDSGGMFVCMHGYTGSLHDFRTCMEGWARAGITATEPDLPSVRQWAENESPRMARNLLDDLGIRAVSSTNQLFLEESGPQRERAIEDLKWKVELAEILGADRLVIPSAASQSHTIADYDDVRQNLIEAAEIARPHNVTLMVEFTRVSTLINNLRTALWVVRGANHPNLAVMMDTFHFWSGMSKFEDLELLENGELHHLHFEDTPDMPPLEVMERERAFPGEGIAPLGRIVEVLKRKGYRRAASLEMFDQETRSMDPYDQAMKARQAIEPLIS